MSTNTSIEWCDSSFNPWIGCTKVSVGAKGACENCYAEVATPTRAMRIEWGTGKPRHRTGPSTWALPLKWERNADAFYSKHGRRQRVFCASLADIFDNEVDPQWRIDLFDVIRATPSLDWLLLTKRIGNASEMLPADWADGYPNVWLGSTVANQEEVDRDIPKLLATPARAHFLSCEPLLSEIDITTWLWGVDMPCATCPKDIDCECDWKTRKENGLPHISWAIVGGESGPGARRFDMGWARDLLQQCRDAEVAAFVKQLGAKPVNREDAPHPLKDRKGGDMSEWPQDLRIRQFPDAAEMGS